MESTKSLGRFSCFGIVHDVCTRAGQQDNHEYTGLPPRVLPCHHQRPLLPRAAR